MAFSLSLTQAIYVYVFVRDKTEVKGAPFVPTSSISETLGIPKPTLVKILQALANARIVETGTGVRGGVRLATAAREATLYDVFKAIEGEKPIFRLEMPFEANFERARVVVAEISRTLRDVESRWIDDLRKIPLASIADWGAAR